MAKGFPKKIRLDLELFVSYVSFKDFFRDEPKSRDVKAYQKKIIIGNINRKTFLNLN